MERATGLLIEIVGGQPGPVVESLGNLPQAPIIELRFEKVMRILGLTIPSSQIKDILTRLGMEVLEHSEELIKVKVPSFRFDISLDVDLIEEIARVYGYNRLPRTRPISRMSLGSRTESKSGVSGFKDRLVSLGYQEVVTYSFVEPELMQRVNATPPAIVLQNPISSDMSAMRTSLWPGLLNTLKHNVNRQHERVRIFELGQVFLQREERTDYPTYLGGLIYGPVNPEVWSHTKRQLDFFDIKGDVETLLDFSKDQNSFRFVPAQHQALHRGQCAALELNGIRVGVLGALDPALQRELGFNNRVYLFEMDIESLQKARIPRIKELSKYPEVNRDLAIVVDVDVSAAQIIDNVRENAGDSLVDLRIFDVYQGDAVEKTKKSIALGLTLQHPSRTLSEDDINEIISRCVKGLDAKFNAKLRN